MRPPRRLKIGELCERRGSVAEGIKQSHCLQEEELDLHHHMHAVQAAAASHSALSIPSPCRAWAAKRPGRGPEDVLC